MEFERDYLMRQIRMLVRFLARLFFGKDEVRYEVLDVHKEPATDMLHTRLLELLAQGDVCKAENLLFDGFEPGNRQSILLALDFYQRLNEWSDEALERGNFSRDEIESGLRDVMRLTGVELP